tara:strand:+ start:131 stop:760 length:630 start_codon:yes stop_codon:yes gene_type:complete
MLEALISNKLILLSLSFSYLLGSIPFGYIFFKYIKNKDIRSFGSGNIGATNINRLLGKKIAALTLFLDFIKVLIPTYVANLYLGTDYGSFCGVCSILGHIFPIWLKFKGGKGVAGFIGYLLITSWPLCFLFLIIWLFSVKIFKYSALGAILSILLNMVFFKASLILQFKYNIFYFIPGEPIELNLTVFISLIILLRHKENIKSIISKKL